MWGRIVEFMIALWIAISPFIFNYPKEEIFLWISNYVCAILIGFFSLICYYFPLRKMHLCNSIISFWFIAFAFQNPTVPTLPLFQNYIVVGVLNLFLCLVPTQSKLPPYPWRMLLEKIQK